MGASDGRNATTLRLLVLLVVAGAIGRAAGVPCDLRQFAAGLVCVCNETYCDTLDAPPTPTDRNHVIIVSSSLGGLRFKVQNHQFSWTRSGNAAQDDYADESGNDIDYETTTVRSARRMATNAHDERVRKRADALNKRFVQTRASAEALLADKYNKTEEFFEDKLNLTSSSVLKPPLIPKAIVLVNRKLTFQSIVGFGGAFTGSVSYLMQQVTQPLADQLYRMYYSLTEGIGYTMMRIPIGGCDFDLQPWAYNEEPANDETLSNFQQLDARDLDRLTQLRQLVTVAGNAKIKLVGSAWSPPPWMKTNNAWSGFGVLKPEYYRTWAEYHLRYLLLMAAQNVRFYAITTGNEPLNGVIGWVFVHFMSLGWTASKQGIWVGDHLGPVFRNSTLANVKLLGGDDQRYVFPWWFEKMKETNPKSLDYLDGFAVHWYWDKLAPASLLDKTHLKWPDKIILNTESCIGDKPFQVHGPLLGSWNRAEEYIKAYMEDLQHSVNGWIDWNLVLDESGGPNYSNNTVDAPVIVSVENNELYKQPMFYAIGHFSRFLLPDSIRLDVKSLHPAILAVGYLRPDSSVVLVLYNQAKLPVSIVIKDENRNIELAVPPKSIHTVIYL